MLWPSEAASAISGIRPATAPAARPSTGATWSARSAARNAPLRHRTPARSGRFGQDRYGRDRSGSESFGRGSRDYNEERGFFERAGDEVRSWFGDEDAERRRDRDMREAGQHRGRGPKGYQRSDARILEDVNDRLTEDPHLDASEIEVRVENREVTLTGTVNSRFEKRHAEDLAESVSGVTHVQNNLRIQQAADAGIGGSMMLAPARQGPAAPARRRPGRGTAAAIRRRTGGPSGSGI